MPDKINLMILQTRHIESISYLTAELVKAFSPDRYRVTLVYLESGEPTIVDAQAHACFFLGLDKTDYKGLRLRAMRKLRPFLEQHHFDVIIANMYKPVHLLMQLRSSVSASLCIGIIHAFGEFDRLGRRWMMRWMLEDRWHMVGVSAPVRDYLVAANCGLHTGNTSFINNAVDVDVIHAQALDATAARTALGLPQDGLMFGTVGRCVSGKRHMTLLKAFHRICEARPEAFLTIIGDGECRPALLDYVVQHNLANRVFLVGQVPQAVRFLRALDVFVLPSESEGFCIALLEAMATGLPVIVNRVEPLASIVADCGCTLDCADINSLAQAMDDCCQLAPPVLRARGAALYERARNHYNIEAFRHAYRSLVERLLPEA